MLTYDELIKNLGLDESEENFYKEKYQSLLSQSFKSFACSNSVIGVDVYFVINERLFKGLDVTQVNNVKLFIASREVNERTIVVKDTVQAMMVFEEYYMAQQSLTSIVVTGSYGKAITKNFIFNILNSDDITVQSALNSNGKVGVLRTISRIRSNTHYYLQELETSSPDNSLSELSKIVRPNICVITNIGFSHINYFKNKEHILDQNYKCADSMSEDSGIVILNADDDVLTGRRYHHKVVTFSINNSEANYRALNIELFNDHVDFDLYHNNEYQFSSTLSIPGLHNVYYALASIAVGFELGISSQNIQRGIADFKTPENRLKIVTTGQNNTFMLDCFETSPETVLLDCKMLSDMRSTGKKIAVLSHITGLGRYSEQCHRDLGKEIAKLHLDEVITYGGLSEIIAEEVNNNGGFATHKYDRDEFIKYTKDAIKANDIFLFKGSEAFCGFNSLSNSIIDLENEYPTPAYWGSDFSNNLYHCDSKGMCLMDITNSSIISGKEIHTSFQCSSLLSLLTILLISKNVKFRQSIEIPPHLNELTSGCIRIGLRSGERYLLSDLIWLSLHKSASDAIYAMCLTVFGSPINFINQLKDLICSLCLVNTCVNDPYGKPDIVNYSSPSDICTIISEMTKDTILKELMISKVRNVTELNSSRVSFYNVENQIEVNSVNDDLCLHSPDITVIKTGNNKLSESCICAMTTDRVAVLLGCPNNKINPSSLVDIKRILTK